MFSVAGRWKGRKQFGDHRLLSTRSVNIPTYHRKQANTHKNAGVSECYAMGFTQPVCRKNLEGSGIGVIFFVAVVQYSFDKA